MDFIKSFFGRLKSDPDSHLSKSMPPPHFDEEFSPFDNFEERGNFPSRGFDIFTDPLEMHRYFEEQMDQMLRNFGFQHFGNNFRTFEIPAIEGHDSDDRSADIREQFLKKGYENSSPMRKQDKDLDSDFQAGNLDLILGQKEESSNAMVPYERQKLPKPSFFHQSVSVKTVTKPDGTIETQKIIKGNDGTEETTITRRRGDKEYSVVKKRDRNGQEEVIENLVNMDESEKNKFLYEENPRITDKPDSRLFDKFFKNL